MDGTVFFWRSRDGNLVYFGQQPFLSGHRRPPLVCSNPFGGQDLRRPDESSAYGSDHKTGAGV
jgi:hypothetical protein